LVALEGDGESTDVAPDPEQPTAWNASIPPALALRKTVAKRTMLLDLVRRIERLLAPPG
jgi:hypothetical protein